jgi:nitrogen regulatory protein PII-like uncharacterized protein
MKKIILALSVSIVLLFACCASAGVTKFKNFSVDVPDGWTAEDDGEGTVSLVSSDSKAAVTISMADNEGMSAKEIAEAFREELKGGALKPTANDGFAFKYTNENGIDGMCVVITDKKDFLAITGTGDDPAIDAIVSSIKHNK